LGVKRTFALGILSLGLLAFLSGCGGGGKKEGVTEVKVAFWGTPEEVDIITHSIEEWQKVHPELKIVFEHTPYTGYDSKVLTRIAGGAAPDIIATEVNYFVTFASKSVLEDLTPWIAADPEFKVSDFFPQVIDRFTVDGKLYAVPRDVAPFACVFYNKELFDQAGIPYPTDDWTWEDLLRIARALTKKDENGRTVQYGFYSWAWQNFVYGNGGALVDDPKKPTAARLTDPKTVEGLQFYADLANLYGVMPTATALTNLGMGVDMMFASGRLGMFLSGVWETPLLRNYSFKWDVAMFPKNRAGVRAFGTGGTGYAILRSSKHKKEAWEVIKALTADAGQAELAERGLAQPARIQVAESEHWATHTAPPANKKMLNEAVQYIVFDPFDPRWREIEDKYLRPALDLVFTGKKTAEEATREVEPKVNAILEGKAHA
jgi:ABC-type glycerol-3-phosphate transport system substrate-binding protein